MLKRWAEQLAEWVGFAAGLLAGCAIWSWRKFSDIMFWNNAIVLRITLNAAFIAFWMFLFFWLQPK